MIICICRNIRSSQMDGKKLTQEKYDKMIKGMQCEMCKEEWKKYLNEDKT